MKKGLFVFTFLLLTASLFAQLGFQRNILFDNDWSFNRGDVSGAENPGFDDAQWRKLDLPHDWSIEDIPGTNSPFDKNAIGDQYCGYTVGGIGWYRKTFEVSNKQKGKNFILYFEGVYNNAEVYFNGQLLKKHVHGYTSFDVDLTEKINIGGKNVVAVKAINEGKNSRWYSGSGIYRHVWLDIVEPVRVAQYGTYITTKEVKQNMATVNIKTTVLNNNPAQKLVKLVSIIKDSEGKEVSRKESVQPIPAGKSFEFNSDIPVKSPALWSLESPTQYNAVSEIYLEKTLYDRTETKFGIRTIQFSATEGFLLNGKSLKIKGGCVHHDNGPLGAKAYNRAEERRVELLKASGFNAIRCAHNPPSPEFLNVCDRLGMLVIDEAFDVWETNKRPQDYNLHFKEWWQKDLENMVYRDRNHPSIIMWSIGNEIPEMFKPEVVAVAKRLADHVRALESTRPVTAAIHAFKDIDPFMATLDVVGYNYAPYRYKTDRETHPNRVMVATESFPYKAFEYWMGVIDHPWVIGDFVWTSFDYIGEASIGWRGFPAEQNVYPWKLAFCGDIDICGWKRPQSYYRDALWNENQLSIFVKPPQPSFETNPKKADWSNWHWHDVLPDWNWEGNERKPLEVQIYSSCEEVELFLNDKSLGKKATNRSTEFMAKWDVPYEAGTLKAVGYTGSKPTKVSELKTTGKAEAIRLSADRNVLNTRGQDLSYITVDVTDVNGLLVPKAANNIKFEIEGSGEIVAVGNGNPVSDESYTQLQRNAWQGKCLVIVKAAKSKGTIKLVAKSEGLKTASITLIVK